MKKANALFVDGLGFLVVSFLFSLFNVSWLKLTAGAFWVFGVGLLISAFIQKIISDDESEDA